MNWTTCQYLAVILYQPAWRPQRRTWVDVCTVSLNAGPTLPLISQIVSRLPCTQVPDCEDVAAWTQCAQWLMPATCLDPSLAVPKRQGLQVRAGWFRVGPVSLPQSSSSLWSRALDQIYQTWGPAARSNSYCFGGGCGIRGWFQRTRENDGEVNWSEAFGNLWPPD